MGDISELAFIVFIFACLFLVCVFTFRYWGDSIYALAKNWLFVVFAGILVVFSTLLALNHDNLKSGFSDAYYDMRAPSEQKVASTIHDCKMFVTAKQEGNVNISDYKKLAAGPIELPGLSYWELCAQTFGMNYWKHDISIKGKNGGQLLCETYQSTMKEQNERVNAWCQTVFANAEAVDEAQEQYGSAIYRENI